MSAAVLRSIAARATAPLIYVLLLILWEASTQIFKIPGWLLPGPSAIIFAARDWAPDLLYNSYVTLAETVLGFLLALVISLPLAVIVAFTVTLRALVYPILLGLQSIPKVALAPLVILWLGL